MADLPPARIHEFQNTDADKKLVHGYIGRANMEGLALANLRGACTRHTK